MVDTKCELLQSIHVACGRLQCTAFMRTLTPYNIHVFKEFFNNEDLDLFKY